MNAMLPPVAGTEDPAPIIQRCLDGDDTAKAAFINLYARTVKNAVLRRVGQISGQAPVRNEVDDFCNDIFVRLLANDCRMLAGLRNARCIEAWLVTVARNHVTDQLRKWCSRSRAETNMLCEEGITPKLGGGVTYVTPADQAMMRESSEYVQQQLERLSPADRLVIELYYLQGLKYAEIAEITGQKINTIASRISRARTKLRRTLEAMESIERLDDKTGWLREED